MESPTPLRIDQVREAHAEDLTYLQHKVLAAHALGYRASEIAEELDISEPTVRRHVGNIIERTLERHGLPRDRGLLITWVWCHDDSCTAMTRTLINNGTYFDRRAHPG